MGILSLIPLINNSDQNHIDFDKKLEYSLSYDNIPCITWFTADDKWKMHKAEPLYTVIVNWNLQEETIACVNSLINAGCSLDKIIVVDNASTDGSVLELRKQFGLQLNIRENEKNLGYGGGLNAGIADALTYHAEWLLLINNDVVVSPQFFNELAATIHTETDYKIFSPLILEYSRPSHIWFLGDKLIPYTLLTQRIAHGKIDQGYLMPVIPVDFISGCAMLIHRSVIEKIGLFSTKFFMYAEEVDFLYRARLAGFRSATITRAKMWHKISVSADRDRPRTSYLKIFNQIRFYKTYSPFWQVPLMFGFTFIRFMVIALKDLIQCKSELILPMATGWVKGWFTSEANDHQ